MTSPDFKEKTKTIVFKNKCVTIFIDILLLEVNHGTYNFMDEAMLVLDELENAPRRIVMSMGRYSYGH